jgi:hypothetical protein
MLCIGRSSVSLIVMFTVKEWELPGGWVEGIDGKLILSALTGAVNHNAALTASTKVSASSIL